MGNLFEKLVVLKYGRPAVAHGAVVLVVVDGMPLPVSQDGSFLLPLLVFAVFAHLLLRFSFVCGFESYRRGAAAPARRARPASSSRVRRACFNAAMILPKCRRFLIFITLVYFL